MDRAVKQRNKRGFTLSEVLVVIAILAILTAVAFPAVARIQKQLEMAKLDEYARQIFLAAQNEVTSMKASGRLAGFSDALSGKVEQAPADYPKNEESWKNLRTVSAGESAAQTYLLRTGSTLVDAAEGGDFLLELNPETGDIYGAFYAKEKISYAAIQEVCADSRDRFVRQPVLLGYYGGSAGGSGAVGVPRIFYPKLKITNGEELYLNFTCDNLLLLRRTQEKLQLDITVADEHGKLWFKVWRGGTEEMRIKGDSISVPLVLDSLDATLSFAEVTKGKTPVESLTPGDNLTITAILTYDNNGVQITGRAEAFTNSLFGSREANGNISVSKVRHLNNLRASCYSATRGATITQTLPIDFNFAHWDKETYYSPWIENPLKTFSPIDNPTLLTMATYNGLGNTISGFPISGNSDVGLFATVENSTLENIYLVDASVRATGSRAGVLAGSIKNTAVKNCGVYLNTLDAENRFFANMPERLEQYAVKGDSYAGGLIGWATGVSPVTDSFAAINVTARQYAGGLFGAHEKGNIQNCYTSGEVLTQNSTGNAGGLVGYAASSTVAGCYSTSKVTGAAYVGGLLGRAGNAQISQCKVYGLVKNSEAGSAGSMIGGGNASYTACAYMSQAGYNDNLVCPAGVSGISYMGLKTSTPNANDSGRPYEKNLVDTPFPFPMLLRPAGATMRHYGNWPAEFRLQTSLVYYERYHDDALGDTYGYYARTSLTADGVEQKANTWVVNTLQNRVCVEDGYAILTTAALTAFRYSRNDGAETAVTVSDTVSKATAKPLESDVSLTFKNDETGGSYTISGTRAYRLPYALQTTGHIAAGTKFYDRLKVIVPGDKTNYTFYYCADFGKNAVNPDLKTANATYPKDPSGSENPVFVRSARQLHLLGRTTYYWSENNSSYDFYFLQETEIDFGKYVSNYCGEPFNMMDTNQNNPHRNLPIGQTGGTKEKQFRSTYDGAGNPIVDYCCVTYQSDGYQFTGLFGEAYQAVLKNIVMTASNPEKRSSYVESNFNNDGRHPGVGALAGLIYEDRDDTDNTQVSVVQNCAVSGCAVQYTGTAPQTYAVGGLVGYNFGKIINSAAVSTSVSGSTNSGSKYIGGLTGSLNGRGSITRCYAGGVLSVNDKGARSVGGISGGDDPIYGFGYTINKWGANEEDISKRNMSITDSYSYCTLSSQNILGGTAVYGVSPAVTGVTLKNNYYLADSIGGGISVSAVSNVFPQTEGELSALTFSGSDRASKEHTYPWSAKLLGRGYPYPSFVTSGAVPVHYGDWYVGVQRGDSAWLTYYEQYQDGTFGCYGLRGDGTEYNTLDAAAPLDNHSKTIISAGYGVCSKPEKSFGIKIGQGDAAPFMNADQMVHSQPLTQIRDGAVAYSLYQLLDNCTDALRGGKTTASLQTTFRYQDVEGKEQTSLRYINTSFAAAVLPNGDIGTKTQPFEIRTQEQLQQMQAYTERPWQYRQTHGILVSSGTIGRISNDAQQTYDGGGYDISNLQAPLFTKNTGILQNIRLMGILTTGSGNSAALSLSNSGTISNCSVSGSVSSTDKNAAGLVYSNSGIISNCSFTGDVTANAGIAGSAAGLVYENTEDRAAITNSYTHGTVEAKNAASGFIGISRGMIGTNTEPIRGCYANCTVISAAQDAAAFVGMQNSGRIQNCYAVGSVQAAGKASGFKSGGAGVLNNCYTVSTINGKTWYPLTQNQNEVLPDCYWAADVTHGGTQGNSAGTEQTLSAIKTINLPGFEVATPETTHPDNHDLAGQAYPYPKLIGLDHWGNWPVGKDSRKIGAFQIYKFKQDRYLNGQSVDIDSGSVQTYYQGRPATKDYGVMFDSTAWSNRADWTVEYTYSYFKIGNAGLQTITESQRLDTSQAATIDGLQNCAGMIFCKFRLPPENGLERANVSMENITFTNGNRRYVFTYDSVRDTFTYP